MITALMTLLLLLVKSLKKLIVSFDVESLFTDIPLIKSMNLVVDYIILLLRPIQILN